MPPERRFAAVAAAARRAHSFVGRLLDVDDFADEQAYAQGRVEVDGGHGFEPWRRVADVAESGSDDRVYALDAATGSIRFGDGVHGRRPAPGARIRAVYRRPPDGD